MDGDACGVGGGFCEVELVFVPVAFAAFTFACVIWSSPGLLIRTITTMFCAPSCVADADVTACWTVEASWAGSGAGAGAGCGVLAGSFAFEAGATSAGSVCCGCIAAAAAAAAS